MKYDAVTVHLCFEIRTEVNSGTLCFKKLAKRPEVTTRKVNSTEGVLKFGNTWSSICTQGLGSSGFPKRAISYSELLYEELAA
jgi:hypothetical protein